MPLNKINCSIFFLNEIVFKRSMLASRTAFLIMQTPVTQITKLICKIEKNTSDQRKKNENNNVWCIRDGCACNLCRLNV